jgi:hypothetical protein
MICSDPNRQQQRRRPLLMLDGSQLSSPSLSIRITGPGAPLSSPDEGGCVGSTAAPTPGRCGRCDTAREMTLLMATGSLHDERRTCFRRVQDGPNAMLRYGVSWEQGSRDSPLKQGHEPFWSRPRPVRPPSSSNPASVVYRALEVVLRGEDLF